MKRVICAILSVLMLVSVLNIGAINASASSMTTSDAAIEMLKQFEGFKAYAYADNGQYSIGYGTSCDPSDYPDGITEEKAEELLRQALVKCENTTNNIADKHGLTFNQGQFDALVLFAYNLGYGWYVGQEDTRLYQAIVNGATGNDFIFAMTMWCKASGSIHTGLVNRRLAEANMYLNGAYSKNPPASYSYVVFDGNGGNVSASIQGYDSAKPVEVKATATYKGYYFAGWYTAKKGGNKVTVLDDTTKGLTLYAHWQKNEPVDSGTITADSLYVRSAASATATAVGGLTKGTKVDIYEIVATNSGKWGRVDNGWISLTYVKLDSENTDTETPGTETPDAGTETPDVDIVLATGTLTATLRIRKGPSTGYAVVGYYAEGDHVEILEMDISGNTTWGRTEKGWISLSYVKLDEETTEPDATEPEATEPDATEPEATEPEATEPEVTEPEVTEPEVTEPEATEPEATEPEASEPDASDAVTTGTVTGTVYVRSSASASGKIIGSITYGTDVVIKGVQCADGIIWGLTDEGWISLNYVKLHTPLMATVTSGLNVRKGAGTKYAVVASYAAKTQVAILETVTVNGSPWGHTAKGWINLKYVKLSGIAEDTAKPETPETPEKPETPETPETPDSVIATGKVTASALFIRKGPGTGYGSVGYYSYGNQVEILEKAVTGNTTWGRTAKGWISLTYVKLDEPVVKPDVTDPEQTEPTEPEATEPEATEPEATEPETPVVPETPSAGSVVATGTITASSLSVRKGPSASAKVLGTISYGTAVEIYELQVADGLVWGRTAKGWISLNYVKLNAPVSATVTASALFIRSKANMNSVSVGMYEEGNKVNIYETKTVNKAPWGRTDRGWINLKYVQFGATGTVTPEVPGDSETPVNPGPGTPSAGDVVASGTVTASALSIRSGASSKSGIIGSVYSGETVKIYELKVGDGILWGRTEKGWISMNYVKLNAPLTATITASTLNIRNKAGFTGKAMGFYYAGDKVTIYSTATVNGLAWALTEKGWISLKYAELEV